MSSNSDSFLRDSIENIESRLLSIERRLEGEVIERGENIEVPISAEDVKIIDSDAMRKSIGIDNVEAFKSEFKIRFSAWECKYYCNVFHTCETTYNGKVFVVRESTGQIIVWNLIESATLKAHGIPFWSTGPNYHHQRESSEVQFGFGKQDGRTCHISTCVSCRADWGSVSFRWDVKPMC